MVKNMQKGGKKEKILSEFHPLQRLHPLQEPFLVQNDSPVSEQQARRREGAADRHPTRAPAAGPQPAPAARGLAGRPGTWRLGPTPLAALTPGG